MRLSKIEGAAIKIERIIPLRNLEFFLYTRPIDWKWRDVQKSFRRWIFDILKKKMQQTSSNTHLFHMRVVRAKSEMVTQKRGSYGHP